MRLHSPGRRPLIAHHYRGSGSRHLVLLRRPNDGPGVASGHSAGGTSPYTLPYRRCGRDPVRIRASPRGDPGRRPSDDVSVPRTAGACPCLAPVLPRCPLTRRRVTMVAPDIIRIGRFRPWSGPWPRSRPGIPSISDLRTHRSSGLRSDWRPRRARRLGGSVGGAPARRPGEADGGLGRES